MSDYLPGLLCHVERVYNLQHRMQGIQLLWGNLMYWNDHKNDLKKKKKTVATWEGKSFFGIWYHRGRLHMIPVNLQIIMDDPNDFLSLSLSPYPSLPVW